MKTTLEQRKQKLIEESYGNNWSLVKDHILENGWIRDRDTDFQHFDSTIKWETTDHDDSFYDRRRPIQLIGIETNNGWINVNSLEDLPKEFGLYHFIPCNKIDEQFIGIIDFELGEVMFFDKKNYSCSIDLRPEMNAWLTSQITHYKPIQKENPPIY